MTRDVIVIDPDRTVLDAAKRMAVKKIGGLVVVQHGRPIGLITDRDILWQVTSKGKNPSKVLVRDIMTSPVATVSRSEEHTSELQSHSDLVCRLLLEKKKNTANNRHARTLNQRIVRTEDERD